MGRGKSQKTIDLVCAARGILEEIQPASVRAVCYRLFTLGVISSMQKSETNKVSTHLTWARENKIIPWEWIVDETRSPECVSAFKDLEEYIESAKNGYRRDRWSDQPDWVEVWSEKGTIRGTLAPVLNEYGVTFRVMHGYGSATTLNQVAMETQRADKPLTVLYVGDWDPSGLHMSEMDLPRRLREYGGDVDLVRLALADYDCDDDLPSFPTDTKQKDPRHRWYRDRYGSRCWELDALSPVTLRDRVAAAIDGRLDHAAWRRAEVVEKAERDSISSILNQNRSIWPGISGQATKYDEGRS